MATRFDYYIQSSGGSYPVGDGAGYNWATGQTFQASANYDIESVKVWLANIAVGTGTLTVGIYATDGGGQPTGSALAQITFDLSTMSIGLTAYEFTLASSASLTNGVQYAIVLSSPDNSENVSWRMGDPDTYTDGKQVRSINGGAWGDGTAGQDLVFETYGPTPAPGKPTTPSPSDSASSITLDESPLSWVDGGYTDTYEVYFREQGGDWEQIGTAQAGVEFEIDFGTLDYGTTYEWRIDATNETDTTTGDTWTFDTVTFNTILPGSPGVGGGGGGGGSGEENSPTGENNMITLRRLVAAANSKIWFEDV